MVDMRYITFRNQTEICTFIFNCSCKKILRELKLPPI